MRLSAKLAAIGITMATVSGSGMFALTGDDAETEPNMAQTGTYAVHDIGITRVSQSTACPTTAGGYDADDVIPAEFTGNTIAMPNGSIQQGTAFCIRNQTSNAVDFAIGIQEAVYPALVLGHHSVEMGACAPGEAAVDSTCADGQIGDLGPAHFQFDINIMSGSTSGCVATSNAPLVASSAVNFVKFGLNLGSGGICKIWVTLELLPNLSENLRYAIQTDSFGFKYIFRGTDGTIT